MLETSRGCCQNNTMGVKAVGVKRISRGQKRGAGRYVQNGGLWCLRLLRGHYGAESDMRTSKQTLTKTPLHTNIPAIQK